jgi:ribonucleoside-diphosphate reductase alpha chain
VAADVARAAVEMAAASNVSSSDNLAPLSPVHTHTIEKIVERIVERPLRRRLPDTRRAVTHKFDVAGHEGYITVGLYDDGQPGEVFIRIAKEGSTIGGLMDTIATLVSVSLQYGVPVESLVRKFEHVRFEPSGMTRNADIPMAKSLVDYIFRWMAMEFVVGYRAANAPQRTKKIAGGGAGGGGVGSGDVGSGKALAAESSDDEPSSAGMSSTLPAANPPKGAPAAKKMGNGHGPRFEPDSAKSFAYDSPESPSAGEGASHNPQNIAPASGGVNLRLAIVADPLSQQGSEMQADAPACDVCGSITVRSGTCYKCLNCGNSMGCS